MMLSHPGKKKKKKDTVLSMLIWMTGGMVRWNAEERNLLTGINVS